MYLNTVTKECVSECPSDFYVVKEERKCRKSCTIPLPDDNFSCNDCYEGAETCFSPSMYHSLTCKSSYTFAKN